MSMLTLKIIAVISMLLDHIGYAADIYALRCVGRLAFPIFAFLIGNGFRHTAHPGRYLCRLLFLAVLSQIPFTLFLYGTAAPEKLNIFLTLSLGLALLWSMERCVTDIAKLLCLILGIVLCAGIETVVPMDYGLRGVLLIVLLYYCPSGVGKTAVFIGIYYLPLWDALLTGNPLPQNWPQSLWGLLSLPLMCLYNRKSGYRSKALQWFFYLFYPAHLLILYLVFR